MGCLAQGGGVGRLWRAAEPRYVWGPSLSLGAIAALAACAADQGLKLWLLCGLRPRRAAAPCKLTPFVDFVLTWNTGISYGMVPAGRGPLGQWALLALKVDRGRALLWIWLARAHSRLTALALGLIIGGALGNAIDRLLYGAVADFVLLHLETADLALQLVRL